MKNQFLIFILFVQCTTLIEFPTPDLENSESPEVSTSIQSVWERVHQSETGFIRFDQDESPLWLSGYVTSSDASGNFFKELFIQDKKASPSRGLRLLLDQTALHTYYQPGMKIFVKLNGLGSGLERGILSLGTYEADGVAPLPEPLIEAVSSCQNNKAVRQVGIEWCIEQSKELLAANVPVLHYYSMGKSDNIKAIFSALK